MPKAAGTSSSAVTWEGAGVISPPPLGAFFEIPLAGRKCQNRRAGFQVERVLFPATLLRVGGCGGPASGAADAAVAGPSGPGGVPLVRPLHVAASVAAAASLLHLVDGRLFFARQEVPLAVLTDPIGGHPPLQEPEERGPYSAGGNRAGRRRCPPRPGSRS